MPRLVGLKVEKRTVWVPIQAGLHDPSCVTSPTDCCQGQSGTGSGSGSGDDISLNCLGCVRPLTLFGTLYNINSTLPDSPCDCLDGIPVDSISFTSSGLSYCCFEIKYNEGNWRGLDPPCAFSTTLCLVHDSVPHGDPNVNKSDVTGYAAMGDGAHWCGDFAGAWYSLAGGIWLRAFTCDPFYIMVDFGWLSSQTTRLIITE